MTISRLKPPAVKEIEKLAATPPTCIKHRYLGGVPGFVLVHTPAGYNGYGLIYRAGGKRKKLTLGSTKRMSLKIKYRLSRYFISHNCESRLCKVSLW